MFVYVKNRFKGFSQKSFVFSENGEKLLLIKGKMVSLSNKTELCDLNGNKVFTIKNKAFPIFKNCAYIYDELGDKKKLLCKIKTLRGKFFKVTKCEYPITINGRLDEGITISFDNEEVAYFEEADFEEKSLISNSFELEINEEADFEYLSVALLSAIVIAIDGLILRINSK